MLLTDDSSKQAEPARMLPKIYTRISLGILQEVSLPSLARLLTLSD
jgi:hypothetical protein